jgi:hypothetical protein
VNPAPVTITASAIGRLIKDDLYRQLEQKLDLSQWDFYVVRRAALESLARGQGLSLNRVATLAAPMTADELRRTVPE